MKNIKHILLMLGAIGFQLHASSQDIHFSQFALSPLLLNPAMAGANYDLNANIQYKDQWKNIGAYRTYAIGVDGRIMKSKNEGFFALGGQFFNDKSGDTKLTTSFGNINPAYHICLNARSYLGAALSLGFGQRSIGAGNMQWGSQYTGTQYDASAASGEMGFTTQRSFVDLGAGMVYSYKNKERYITANDNFYFNIGLSVQHITQPSYGFMENSTDKLFRKYVLFFNSCVGRANMRVSFLPNILVAQQGPNREVVVGSWFRYLIQEYSHFTGFVKGTAVSLGVFYRNMDALNFAMQFEIQSFAVAVSYDVNISKLNVATSYRGGTELTLRYVLPNPFNSGSGGRTLL